MEVAAHQAGDDRSPTKFGEAGLEDEVAVVEHLDERVGAVDAAAQEAWRTGPDASTTQSRGTATIATPGGRRERWPCSWGPDLHRSRSFYEHLGWRGQEVQETVFFQPGGQAVVLWGRDKVAADAGIVDDGSSRFGGIVLAHNVASREQVDEVVSAAEAAAAR